MPAAKFARDAWLPVAPGVVWEAITDVARLVEWVGILSEAEEVERLARYRATLTDRLGPFRLRADLDIRVPAVEEGRLISATAVGEDRQVASRISVVANVSLEGRNGGTTLFVDGEYEVAGRVATLGASMIRKKADQIVDEFFTRAQEEIA